MHSIPSKVILMLILLIALLNELANASISVTRITVCDFHYNSIGNIIAYLISGSLDEAETTVVMPRLNLNVVLIPR